MHNGCLWHGVWLMNTIASLILSLRCRCGKRPREVVAAIEIAKKFHMEQRHVNHAKKGFAPSHYRLNAFIISEVGVYMT